uniref:Tumor protein p53-inducible protein 11 n=1 Tax=Parascaris equorum TaxID=6256 RepID=A0A914S238_PAREQ
MQLSDSEQCVGRKQSASDLQSRLKTRKLLGVGELISQLLGINESLYCLVTPSIGSYIEFGYSTASSEQLAVRMYGAAMFAFGLLFRGFRMAGIIGSLVYQSLLDTQGSVCRQVLRYFDETFRHSDHSPSRSSSSDEKEKTS